MLRFSWRHGACALALTSLAVAPALSTPDTDLTGDWTLSGKNGVGAYTGTVHFERNGDEYTGQLAYNYVKDNDSGSARFTGTFDGTRLKGKRLLTTGITGVLSGTKKKPVEAHYTLSADGLKLVGTYAGKYHETFLRSIAPGPSGDAKITADPLLTFVPGAPGTVFGDLAVDVQSGKVRLDVQPQGALKVLEGGKAVSELDAGKHALKMEALKEGSVEVRVLSGGQVIDRASVQVKTEEAYLVVFGYMGEEVTYLESDMAKAKSHVIPKLKAAGYTVIEDGKSYGQSAIDGKLTDSKTYKKAIVDWCTTTADWNKYFDRQTVKGYLWSSHGFMEPYPGCPDNELKTFESRQWTCADGDPSVTGDKHFIREWRGKFEKNTYKVMDFALNHACCTGGIGDYANEAWEYCGDETKTRVQNLFGKLPAVSELSFTTHDSLKGHFNFQQNFNGSAYFGMSDVRWDELEASIKP